MQHVSAPPLHLAPVDMSRNMIRPEGDGTWGSGLTTGVVARDFNTGAGSEILTWALHGVDWEVRLKDIGFGANFKLGRRSRWVQCEFKLPTNQI